MRRNEFERVTPEEAGIASASIHRLIDKLESGFTEPHGLMIMRGGKVCAEGWWSPYAPGIRHGLQSHTKTYAATAVGIAYTEGLLKLEDRIIDIFKDEAPVNPSENLKLLTVHDVLCMGCGMDKMPFPSENWIRDFLATPVNHKPGTAFMYNSTGSTLLGAIVRKLTGLGLHGYLKPRLFDKIGIDADNLRWLCMPDGMEIGGGGMYASTEDNLRLMLLYARGGVWEGERILAEDYVRRAVSLQNDSASEAAVNPPALDNFVGYGYQIWMCRPKGVYRADGAMGQFTIVAPDKDLLIAITENASGITGGAIPQKALDTIWEFLDEVPDSGSALAEKTEASEGLARRLASLSLPRPRYAPFSAITDEINGAVFKIESGRLNMVNSTARFMTGEPPAPEFTDFSFNFASGSLCAFTYSQADMKDKNSIQIALDGSRRENIFGTGVPSAALASGAWVGGNVFEVAMRWIETTGEFKYRFAFEGNKVTVETEPIGMFMFKRPEPVIAYKKLTR